MKGKTGRTAAEKGIEKSDCKTMKRTVMTVLLSVILVIGVVCGVYFLRQAAALRADGESAVAAAEGNLTAAQTRYDALNPETETGAAAWAAAEQEVYSETQEKIDSLKTDNAALDESIAAMEKEVEGKLADEDTAYYNSVYEEMQKGVDQVEEYLKGN